MRLKTALELGRVSNLPTVWSNVLAGAVLSGGWPGPIVLLLTIIAMSLMYIGGMFLNDAFDAEIDRAQSKDRPIPRGDVTRAAVLYTGMAMLVAAILLMLLTGLAAGVGALALAVAIIAYDRHHKNNPLSPLLMGLCRVLVYVTAAMAAGGSLASAVIPGALMLLCYLIGLTYAAKQENFNTIGSYWPLGFLILPFVGLAITFWSGSGLALPLILVLAGWVLWSLSWLRPGPKRRVPVAVVSLIAGISLLDAALLAAYGATATALLAVVCFVLTLLAQRWVSGT